MPAVRVIAVAQVSLVVPGGGVTSAMFMVPKPVPPAKPAMRIRNWSPTLTPPMVAPLWRPQKSSLQTISMGAAQVPL